jgi:hypothetical protein
MSYLNKLATRKLFRFFLKQVVMSQNISVKDRATKK